MATVNAFSAQLVTTLLEGTTTVLTSPGSEETGTVLEVFGGFPQRIAGSASAVNLKLGMLTNPLWLAIYGDEGISFQISSGGDALEANPFAFLADTDNGLGISEIWVTNSEPGEKSVTILAAE